MFALTFDAEQELRILEECHAEELFALTDKNRAHLKKWLPWLDLTRSAVDTRNFIGRALEGFAKGIG
jgi:ribosomal-protein-serine acetyltransferase